MKLSVLSSLASELNLFSEGVPRLDLARVLGEGDNFGMELLSDVLEFLVVCVCEMCFGDDDE